MAQPLFNDRSPRRPRLHPTPVSVRFVVNKVAMGQALLRVLRFLLSVSLRLCSMLIFIFKFTLNRRINDRRQGILQKKNSLRTSESTYKSEHALVFLSVVDVTQCQTALRILYRPRLVGLLTAT